MTAKKCKKGAAHAKNRLNLLVKPIAFVKFSLPPPYLKVPTSCHLSESNLIKIMFKAPLLFLQQM